MKQTLRVVLAALTLLPSAILAQAPYTPTGSTLILYHFDEGAAATTAVDSSGHGRDATYGSAAVRGVTAQPGMGNAVAPGGPAIGGNPRWTDSANANGQNSPLYQLASNSFTIEMWIRLDELPQSVDMQLLTIHPSDQTFSFDLNLSIIRGDNAAFGGALSLGAGGAADLVLSSKINWELNEWYHIAVTYDAKGGGKGDYRFYVNRAGDTSTPTPISQSLNRSQLQMLTTNTNTRTLDVGNRSSAYGDAFRFRGSIDEFRISSEALTAFSIPEPSTAALGALSALAFVYHRRRRNRQAGG